MSAQRKVPGADARDSQYEHFTVVHPGYHRQWANWIHQVLDGLGHQVSTQRWDPPRNQPLDEALGDLLLADGRVLLVLSEWFFGLGPRREGEWDAALRGYVAQHRERFAAVNLTNRVLPTATAVLRPVDLWGAGPEEAEHRLLTRLELPADRPRRRTAPDSTVRFPDDPPPIWGEVPRRNAEFTGRDELLNALQQRLTDAPRGAAACALVGMSGIGKTELAAEFAHRFSSDYDVVWWVRSDVRGTLRERFGELAPPLGLPAATGPGERIRAIHEALRVGRPHRRWLMVFDGWDDLDDAEDLLPPGEGHVLITSRNQSWRERTDTLPVSGFDRSESVGYLMRRAGHITAAQADDVAVEFSDVPLPLAQAAAWLGESGMAVPEYLRMMRDNRFTEGPHAEPLKEYPQASLTSWSILINKLRQTQPRAVELLALCTSFAPGRIPVGLVRALPEGELPERLRWIVADPAAWSKALDALVTFSVLTRETGGHQEIGGEPRVTDETVMMHRLVHSIVSRLTAIENREAYRRVIRRALTEADPGNPLDSRQWPRYAALIAHLEPAGALGSTNPRMQETLINCLRYCYRSGEYSLGAGLAERMRDRWAELLPADSPQWRGFTTQQTNILRARGDFRHAYELDRAMLRDLQEFPSEDESALLLTHSTLAADLRYLGRYEEALDLQRQTREAAERLFGPDDFITLNTQHNQGVGLRLLGRYAEAYEVDLKALRGRERVLSIRHAATLHSGNACAHDLRLLGRYRDAQARQELVIRQQAALLGADHPQTLWARHHLAVCEYRAGGPRGDVGVTMGGLLNQLRQVHGPTHYLTMTLVTDYGNFLREHGELSRAKDLVTEAEETFRTLLGPPHPVPTGMQSNAGLVLQAEGDRAGALNLFEQAWTGLRTVLGDDHPWTLGCALNAAGGRNFTGRLDSAAELSRDTLRRARQVLGGDHPLTLSCEIALAADLRALREREEAGKIEEDALQRLTRTMGAQHPHTLDARQRTRPHWDFEAYLG